MNIPAHFSDNLTLREQILYAISLIKDGSLSELMAVLMELKGVSSEEGVAELTIETEQELDKMIQDNVIQSTGERHSRRYVIGE